MASRSESSGPEAAGPADAPRRAAVANLPARIAFLGFGLMGGSVAMALREAHCGARLAAWTPSGAGPAEGLARGLLDAAPETATEALDGAGLVILAGPPTAILGTIADLGGQLHGALAPDATITDVGSTKGLIVAAAEDLGLPFVGGHPMAGRESSGVAAATADLFVDRPWVIVPGEGVGAAAVSVVEALATAVGARPVRMAAIEHDLAVAAISHLPLLAAAALVEAVAGETESWPVARTLAASGWRDMTRLARGDPDMGAGILATNARPIAGMLRAYRHALDGWLAELDALIDESRPPVPGDDDVAHLRDRLEAARAALDPDVPG